MGMPKWLCYWLCGSKPDQVPDELPPLVPVETKEDYYNDKYPKVNIIYKGRTIPNSPGNVQVDVRDFFNRYDSQVKTIAESLVGTDEDLVLAALSWIVQNIKYTSDQSNEGVPEYWQFPFETLKLKKGDCEDGAILLANILTACGVPYWKLRLSAGWVEYKGKKIGHAYLTYYVESQDRWVILDWCYYPTLIKIENRPDYKDESKYQEVWFSWNEKYSFSKGLNLLASAVLN